MLSLLACVIVLASFAIFVVDQSTNASGEQQAEVAQSSGHVAASQKVAGSHPSGLHKVIDEASSELTSPFASIVTASSSEWGSRLVQLVLALLVYGLGVGYLIRVVDVRV
jgi:hypothetical protein